MKNKLMIMGMIVFLIIANCLTIYAGTLNSVKLQASNTNVKAGETFSVKIKVSTNEGVNGLVATFNYDTEKLELVEKKLLDNTNFSTLSGATPQEIVILANSSEVATEIEIYEFTFKVKDGIAAGSTADINLESIHLSTFADSNSEHDLAAQKLTITVAESQTGGGEQPPVSCTHTYETENNGTHHWQECTKCGDEKAGSKEEHNYKLYVDNGDGTHSSTCSECNYKLTENHTEKDGKCVDCKIKISNNNNNNNTNTNSNKNNTNTNSNKNNTNKNTNRNDNSTANKDIPKAGLNSMLATGIVAVVIIAIVMYVKNKKYQDII